MRLLVAGRIDRLFGSRVISFAYPYGIYNNDVYKRVRGCFDLAYCAGPEMEGFNDRLTDRHLQRRTAVQTKNSVVDVACSVRWGFKPVNGIRSRLRLRSRFHGWCS